MHLKRLEIHGFKTFASHTVLEFRPGITAIIGPNGSGKSNLNDAIRWVLGEQSYASMRSKRTEDVIFSGGGRRAPSGFAEVSLTIDNSDRLLPVSFNEVTITRRANRNGENEYFINRSRVRLRDVHEAVGPLGGSYTIINQGLVDAALTLRPEERRRLFEDAAEIGTFVARKTESEARLRETSANMARCADVLGELEPRLRSLKRQATLARSYRELHDELRGLLVAHYTQAWAAAQRTLVEAEAHAAAQAAALDLRRSGQVAATDGLRAAREALRELRDRLGTLHNESSALHSHAEATQRDLAVGAERLAALARREEDAARTQRDLSQRRDELEHERAAITARLQAAEQRLDLAHAASQQHEHAISTGEATRRTAQQQLDGAQREAANAAAALAEAARRAAQIDTRRTQLSAEQAQQTSALAAAETALGHSLDMLAAAETQLADAQRARAEMQQVEERARAASEHLRTERSAIDEALAAARRIVADLDARFESLNRLQRSYAGTFAGVRAALQWAETQHRAGFALVSALIRTPAQIETAVEVALGSRLQNIAVERWEDAEDAIAALKTSGAGRATFLPLDSIRAQGSEPRTPNSDPQILGIAAALVDYDQHYHDVVWNLLGRTLVVEDLSTARRVLRQLGGGWVLVTLAGEQVNSSGAVTGGAQIKEAGVLRRERELRELPEQVAAARQLVEQHSQARAQLETELATAERAMREAETARRRSGHELEQRREAEGRARRDVERAEGVLDLQRQRLAQFAADLAALDKQQRALGDEHVLLEARERAAHARLIELRDADQARAEAERTMQVRLAELRNAAAAVEGELRAERALMQSQDQQLARLERQRAEAETRTDDLERERASLRDELAALDAVHAGLLAQIDDLRSLIDPSERELAAIEAHRAVLEQHEAEATAALLEAESVYGRATIEAQRARDRLDTLWERAAADDVDVEHLNREQEIGDRGQEMADGEQNPELPPLPSPLSPDLTDQIQTLRTRVARLGAVNPLALEEYDEASGRYEFMRAQLDDLQHAADALGALIAELDEAMHVRFTSTFQSIAVEFEKCFVRLFGGGEAKLFLTGGNGDAAQNGDEQAGGSIDGLGIDILVRPPGKRQQNIALLSGGERALTASALLFAILAVNPSPFCVLDEVDAALDEANVGRFRAMLADLTAQTQFLIVTHNRATIEVADTIYGVSMGDDGASRVLSVRLEELDVE